MRAPELLTCPFCGSNDVDNKRADARYHCYRCGADGPQIPYAPDDKAWTWQTRATQPDPRDEVIATLVEALDNLIDAITAEDSIGDRPLIITGPTKNLKWLIEATDDAYAALAAAKAVAK